MHQYARADIFASELHALNILAHALAFTHPSHVSLLQTSSSVRVLERFVGRPHRDAVAVFGASTKPLEN